MCGIAGFIEAANKTTQDARLALVRAMTETLHHRGPDDGGAWAATDSPVALGMRRLAVVDLSPQGHQPMHTACGRYTIVYNGEIYNAPELRRALEQQGALFRGHSDTEVILEGCARWGVFETAQRLIGMFAFALWDGDARTCTLVRDRLGIKPLYIGRFGQSLVFGSELKAVMCHPDAIHAQDLDALSDFFSYGFIPGPRSIFKHVEKMTPGTVLTIPLEGAPQSRTFWDLDAVIADGMRAREGFALSDAQATDQLEALLMDATARRMVADVPLGAFLSGGIDSTMVVACMQHQSPRPVQTFSVGFSEADYNEAGYARAVAAHLGTDHHELIVGPQDVLPACAALTHVFDEPFADSSQLPTYLVSKLAREHVTVALSGDGGDELFAGYNRHAYARRLSQLSHLPRPLRRVMATLLHALKPEQWDALLLHALPQMGDKLHKLGGLLGADSLGALYHDLLSQGQAMVGGAHGFVQHYPDGMDQLQAWDMEIYLRDDILTKVDRASMAVSLEARVPLLDHRVVTWAWGLPQRMKMRHGESKWILRQVLDRHVPRALMDRPKMGFGLPLGAWMRGPLREWVEGHLSASPLDPQLVQARWQEHVQGKRNWQYFFWTLVMFNLWQDRWGRGV